MKPIDLVEELRDMARRMPNADVEDLIEYYPENCLSDRGWKSFWYILSRETYVCPVSGMRHFY